MEQVKKTKISLNEIKKRQKRNYILWLFVLPAFLFILIFNYVPMYGVLIAFQDFVPGDEILSASTIWVGLANFQMFFEDYMFLTLLENTFLLCFWGFVIGFPLPVAIALMLNSMRNKQASRIIQIIYYIPHFISLVVMVGMLYLFFGQFGLVNNVLDVLGCRAIPFFLEEDAFPTAVYFFGRMAGFRLERDHLPRGALGRGPPAARGGAPSTARPACAACSPSTFPPLRARCRSCSSSPSAISSRWAMKKFCSCRRTQMWENLK